MSALEQAPARPGREGIQTVLGLAAIMWLVEIVDAVLGQRLDEYGIEPRDVDGLSGVIAAPFLHAGFGHLAANTVPFLVMGVVIALGGALRVVGVTVIVGLVSGIGTWLTGPENSLHVGASGIVFGYATYLLARGFFSRRVLEIAVGLVIGVLWGGALLAGLEPREGISWQGHLFGAIGGLVAARFLSARRASGPEAPASPALTSREL